MSNILIEGASNPCWGESICITLSEDLEGFKCICFGNSQGKYCQQQIKKSEDLFKPLEAVAIEEVTTDVPMELSTSTSTDVVTINTETSTQKSTTMSLLNLFIPSKKIEPCNHNTCQLGRCLENGICRENKVPGTPQENGV